jgi:predicted naringenin-chalcone synthase
LSKIISIGTALPAYRHAQKEIFPFMSRMYAFTEADKRKLKFLYHQSGISWRYSVINDYGRPPAEWKFYPYSENLEPFPSLEQRMTWFNKFAPSLSVKAIRNCLEKQFSPREITHLITVSCTGMSAPGLDLQVMELLDLPEHIFRTSINFMGCYAAIHGLKLADALCQSNPDAKVMVVCTELCTLHFQREATNDNITSSLLFGDGSAAVLVTGDNYQRKGLRIRGFYSEVVSKGKKDMAWELSSTGFTMTLSNYIPELIEEDFARLVVNALGNHSLKMEDIGHWCIHPGGKRILEAIHKSLQLAAGRLDRCYEVLDDYGNMSSPTILFVLERILRDPGLNKSGKIFGAAFGPGLTMETFIASTD